MVGVDEVAELVDAVVIGTLGMLMVVDVWLFREVTYVATYVWFSAWTEFIVLVTPGVVLEVELPPELLESSLTAKASTRITATTPTTSAVYTAGFLNLQMPQGG